MSPVAALSFTFLAISYSPWFSWMGNALSDLGVSSAAAIFNFGMILAGLLLTIFAVGFIKHVGKGPLIFAGAFLLVLGAVSFMAVGVFPESTGWVHVSVSAAFFTLELIGFLLIGAAFIQKSSEKRSGLFSISAAAWVIGVWMFWFWAFPQGGVAIPELLSLLAFQSWSIVFGARLLKKSIL
jgi:hypothetical membrane protein